MGPAEPEAAELRRLADLDDGAAREDGAATDRVAGTGGQPVLPD